MVNYFINYFLGQECQSHRCVAITEQAIQQAIELGKEKMKQEVHSFEPKFANQQKS